MKSKEMDRQSGMRLKQIEEEEQAHELLRRSVRRQVNILGQQEEHNV